jgi:hypothetical protein
MATKKEALPLPTKGHFFGSNYAYWRTNSSITELIKEMRTDKVGFMLCYVPLPEASTYEINFYAPQVEGTIYLGNYE